MCICVVHSIVYKTGATNVIYLPRIIQFSDKNKVATKRYAEIADFIKLGREIVEEKIALLVKYLRCLNDLLILPKTLVNMDWIHIHLKRKVCILRLGCDFLKQI